MSITTQTSTTLNSMQVSNRDLAFVSISVQIVLENLSISWFYNFVGHLTHSVPLTRLRLRLFSRIHSSTL